MVYFYLLLHLATVGVYKGGNDPGNPKMSDTTRIASFGPLVSFFFFFLFVFLLIVHLTTDYAFCGRNSGREQVRAEKGVNGKDSRRGKFFFFFLFLY